MRKAVFLDRDGLINRKAAEHDYIRRWEDFSFLPGVPETIARLNDVGYLVLIVTNQRGVARGLMTMKDVERIHRKMLDRLKEFGAHVDGIYVCPHDIGQCHCRKPDIGLFLRAEQDFDIDKGCSWMVGDGESDMEAGRRFGLRTILTEDLSGAVKQILEDL